jgi:hypothetical protein
MTPNKQDSLAAEVKLKIKAALISQILCGRGSRLSPKNFEIPNFSGVGIKALKDLIESGDAKIKADLRGSFQENPADRFRNKAVWLASKFDQWEAEGFGIFSIGQLCELEKVLGKIRIQKYDFPPYAQVLLQGLHPPAFQHPEYHLSVDLALLYNLLVDSEYLLGKAEAERKTVSSEPSQSLSRSVILTCFNLLEAFASGLLEEWILTQPHLTTEKVEELRSKKLQHMPIEKRFPVIIREITGRGDLIGFSQAPFKGLFGKCKDRSNSFVHCEPGYRMPKPTTQSKEMQFYAATFATAKETMNFTLEAIRTIWTTIHKKDGPSWLPNLSGRQRFEGVNFGLAWNREANITV